jgi:hypothetical protein
MRLVLFCLAVILFGCTTTVSEKTRRDVMVVGALRRTSCTRNNLKITNVHFIGDDDGCLKSDYRRIAYQATCEGRTWTCRQDRANDTITECIEDRMLPSECR